MKWWRTATEPFVDRGRDGNGDPWSDEPVPELDAGVAAHWSGTRLWVLDRRRGGPDDMPYSLSPDRSRLVRHYGMSPGGSDVPEWLPVHLDERGMLPPYLRQPEAMRERTFAGGAGSVRSTTGRHDGFRRCEVGPMSPIPLRRNESVPEHTEGPAEIAYFWDGYREPIRPFGGLVITR